jgi:DNA repair exonuclease SbcCD ATPase subunit
MIQETIQRLEARLRGSEALPENTRDELLTLLATLRAEIAQLPAASATQAQNIAELTDRSAKEAAARNPERLQRALDELVDAARGFEESHPQLVQIVNNIANTLASLGI